MVPAGDAQVCPDQTQPGFTHYGSFAEFVVLHAADANLVAIPDSVTSRPPPRSVPLRHRVPRPRRPRPAASDEWVTSSAPAASASAPS